MEVEHKYFVLLNTYSSNLNGDTQKAVLNSPTSNTYIVANSSSTYSVIHSKSPSTNLRLHNHHNGAADCYYLKFIEYLLKNLSSVNLSRIIQVLVVVRGFSVQLNRICNTRPETSVILGSCKWWGKVKSGWLLPTSPMGMTIVRQDDRTGVGDLKSESWLPQSQCLNKRL